MDPKQNNENRSDERGDFKKRIHEGIDWLKQTEDRARKFANQNLADIAAAARGRLQQLRDHPDLDLLHDNEMRDRVERRNDGTEYVDRHPSTAQSANGTPSQPLAPPPFDPKAGAPDADNPTFGNAAPGTIVGGPDQRNDDVRVPGEPRFDRPNAGFSQPNAVDLNNDGTLRQAPNSTGAREDVRK